MSRREKQTNKTDAAFQPKGRPTRAQRKSVIAEAMRYEAVQGTPADDEVETATTPSPQDFAAPPLEVAQTSVFSAFGKDAVKSEVEGFEGARPGQHLFPEKPNTNDMTKQCSMVHRMMEMDKSDVDPRDLHKLLPSTMLSSESLDLRPDGKLVRGMSGLDVHKLLEDQAKEFHAERAAKVRGDHEGSSMEGARLSPTAEEQDGIHSPAKACAQSSGNYEQAAPKSPVTGWPAAAVLGVMHPLNHGLGPVVTTAPPSAPAPDLMTQNPLIYSESTPGMTCLNGTPGGVLFDWTTAAAAYHPKGGQIYPSVSYPATTSTPVILEHPAQEEQYSLNYCAPNGQTAPGTASPQNTSSPRDSESSSSSDKARDADDVSKKFKSLEAALAWCHVQHSQKQVPVVPKDDVRKLVDFQLNSGKPIRAPWYRPQNEKMEEAPVVEKPVERKPMIPTGKPRRAAGSVNKAGTGFFCPPGSSMTRV